jgi:hypothetical protein
MTNMIDNAIQRLQAIALACEDVPIKHAPDYPVEDAAVLPFSIAHLISGTSQADNSSTVRFLPIVAVDFHFSRVAIGNAYKQIDLIAVEYARRLGADPTLGGAVDTIVFPISFEVLSAEWDRVATQMLRFSVPLKTLENPIS